MTDMTQEQIEVYEAAKVVKPKSGFTTKQIMAQEMAIKRAAILQVRRFLYGPRCAPTLRAQAMQFCSFGALVKLEELERVRTRD